MARSRILKPEFWSDEKLAQVPREARLAFAGLWTCSADYGVTKGHPAWLKAQIFPYDTDLTLPQFQQWLSDLERIEATEVDLLTLKQAGVVSQLALAGKVILSGSLTRKVSLKGLGVSKGARAAIAAAGGSIAAEPVVAAPAGHCSGNEPVGPRTAGDFLECLIDALVERLIPVIDDLREQMDRLEDAIIDPNVADEELDLSDIRRQVIHLRRFVGPQRDALLRLVHEKAPWFDDINRGRMRETADRLFGTDYQWSIRPEAFGA